MALLTDGSVSTVADLVAYEANLPDIAVSEEIDLTTKLRLAQTEVAAQIEASSQRPGNLYLPHAGSLAAGGADSNFGRFQLNNVVVTPPLKLWHTFQTLAIVYRDIYNRKLNDKYLPKWQEYKELASWAADLLYQSGIGLTAKPVARSAHPALDTVSSSLPAMALYVRAAWIGSTGAEGAGSLERAFSTAPNSALRVSPATAPPEISGWNVYVGTRTGQGTRQNSTPLAAGAAWIMPEAGLVAGQPIGDGQAPDFFKTVPRFLMRG